MICVKNSLIKLPSQADYTKADYDATADDCKGVETCISLMGLSLIRMVRSVETKRMTGTKEKIGPTGRIPTNS